MTEPVAGTAPVRRTVRVATALVAGQAVLCAVIGWVTFGPSEAGPQAVRSVEPLAPLPVVPSVVVPPPAPPQASPSAPSRSARAKSSASRSPAPPKRPRATTKPAPPATEEPPPTLVIAPPEPDETRTAISPGLIGTVTPTPVETVQGPVTVGEKCEPEDARGVTADDRRVRCVRNDDGDLRWQII